MTENIQNWGRSCLLAAAGHKIREDIEDCEEDVLSEFRDFLDDVSPEDFSA